MIILIAAPPGDAEVAGDVDINDNNQNANGNIIIRDYDHARNNLYTRQSIFQYL